jgi:molybdenum cofactor cytidylyltransferase
VRPALVILAAGASSRLGRCKALVTLGGVSVLARLSAAGAGVDEGRALLVAGEQHAQLVAAAPAGVRVLENRDWREGRTGTVRLAHRALPERALLLAPVDVPLVPARVFEALAQSWDELGDPPLGWLAPRLASADQVLHGRYGHPVVLGRALLDRLDLLGASTPLMELRGWARPLASIEVFDPEVLDDLDTPEDLARLEKRLEARADPSA